MDLSNLKIDLLDPTQTYLFNVPEDWGLNKIDQLEELVAGLKARQIKGIIVVGEVTVEKIKQIFDAAPEEKKVEILESLGYYHVNPLDFEPQTK